MAIGISAQAVWGEAFNPETYALKTMDYAHHEIHRGSSFVASGTIDLGNAATLNVTLKTPNTTEWCHTVIQIVSESEMAFNLYEGFLPSGTADGGTIGVAVTAYNRDRNSSSAAGMLVYTGATVGTAGTATAGTLIEAGHWGSGRGVGGSDRGVSEFILKQNTNYLVQMVNATSNANYTAWEVDWYEHTNKE